MVSASESFLASADSESESLAPPAPGSNDDADGLLDSCQCLILPFKLTALKLKFVWLDSESSNGGPVMLAIACSTHSGHGELHIEVQKIFL